MKKRIKRLLHALTTLLIWAAVLIELSGTLLAILGALLREKLEEAE